MFFDFLGIPGESMTERFKIFYEKAKNDNGWPLVALFNPSEAEAKSRRKGNKSWNNEELLPGH